MAGRQEAELVDVGFFLNQRTAFIRQFYDAASLPFFERKRKIEAEEAPFVPPYSEDGEPPFLTVWIEADESLHVLGYSCVSMLAAALHLYLKTWEAEFGKPVADSFKTEFKKGWINGYKAYFATHFGIHFDQGPANLSVLEEIVLARNRVQHRESITSQRTSYSSKDIEKLGRVFFVDDRERSLFADADESESSWLFPPSLRITKEKLITAITEVEKFSGWLETQIILHVYP